MQICGRAACVPAAAVRRRVSGVFEGGLRRVLACRCCVGVSRRTLCLPQSCRPGFCISALASLLNCCLSVTDTNGLLARTLLTAPRRRRRRPVLPSLHSASACRWRYVCAVDESSEGAAAQLLSTGRHRCALSTLPLCGVKACVCTHIAAVRGALVFVPLLHPCRGRGRDHLILSLPPLLPRGVHLTKGHRGCPCSVSA
jgi:hypothetical protein